MQKQRPTGVTVLGVLAIIAGSLNVLVVLLSALRGAAASSGVAAPLGARIVVAGVVMLVIGILYIAVGVGFLGLKAWGWTLGVVVSVIDILLDIINTLIGGDLSNIIDIIIAAVIVYYLFRPEVRSAFGRA